MKIDIRKYPADNLNVVDVISNRDKLLNIILIGFTDDKKNISLKRAIFDTNCLFVHCKEYKILDICEEIVNAYGDKSDIEKLCLADRIFTSINYIN